MADEPLLNAQKHADAVLPASITGCPPVLHFGDPAGEYRAARSDAVVFDLSDRSQIEITGRDRAKFLHNFCTNNINALQPGQGCEAFVTNVKGRVLGHVFVFADDESLWIETVAGGGEPLIAHLDRYRISEDVDFHNRTGEIGELLVTGPGSARVLEKLGTPAASLGLYAHLRAVIAEIAVSIRHVDWLGVPGFLISASRDRLADVWRAFCEAAVDPAGSEAFHALRIEAGFPLYGTDISKDNLAQEVARTKRAISFTKGCYLGQEPIARIDALGHVNRELRALRLDARPAGGAAVHAGGQEVGAVTSSAVSPTDSGPLALAYLKTKHAAPGTQLTVDCDGRQVPASVFWPADLG